MKHNLKPLNEILRSEIRILSFAMQFQLSIFYNYGYLSYQITSEDAASFHFRLVSAPPDGTSNPDNFIVKHPAKDQWQFETPLDKEFQQAVIKKLKETKL